MRLSAVSLRYMFAVAAAFSLAACANTEPSAADAAKGEATKPASAETPAQTSSSATRDDKLVGQFSPTTPLVVEPTATAQSINWKTLEDVKFQEKYYEQINSYMLFPTFGEELKTLNGKKVKISGYVIPVEQKQNLFVLSAFMNSSCFFCGQAGPQSVLELDLLRKHPELRMDDWKTFEGVLRLNDSDIDRLTYVLEKAEIVQGK